jgi:small-conductance mechanosensitive channel
MPKHAPSQQARTAKGDTKPLNGMSPRRILLPLLLLALSLLLLGNWQLLIALIGLAPGSPFSTYGGLALATAGWLAAAWCVVRILNAVVWPRLAGRPDRHVPRLLIDLIAGAVWVVAAIVIFAHVFHFPLLGLATTSSVAIAIIGLAARDMIASLFSGIAINVERPYQIGDWIEVEPGVVGKVLEVSWLTTRTVTRDGIGMIVPNAQLATAPFRNYNHPQATWRDSVTLPLDPGLPAERVERVLLAALNAVPEVARQANRPDLKIDAVDHQGVHWRARYWVSDYGTMPEVRYAVWKALLDHLHHAGIALALPRQDLYFARMPERLADQRGQLKVLLGRNSLFAELTDDELTAIAREAQSQFCPSGSAIVHEGDPGASLFVLAEGLLRVYRTTEEGERRIAELTPGAVFGEFSLLTGEPRSATVVPHGDALVYEIDKSAIAPIVTARAEIAKRLSWILAQRRAQQQLADLQAGAGPDSKGGASGARIWLERLQAFFGLSRV